MLGISIPHSPPEIRPIVVSSRGIKICKLCCSKSLMVATIQPVQVVRLWHKEFTHSNVEVLYYIGYHMYYNIIHNVSYYAYTRYLYVRSYMKPAFFVYIIYRYVISRYFHIYSKRFNNIKSRIRTLRKHTFQNMEVSRVIRSHMVWVQAVRSTWKGWLSQKSCMKQNYEEFICFMWNEKI